MKQIIAAAAALATIFSGVDAACSQDALGNYYCAEVNAVHYSGFKQTGSYNKITNMNVATGKCTSVKQTFVNSSPLDEEVSLHFRGPLRLKQFAVYTPSAAAVKREMRHAATRRKHVHSHNHSETHHTSHSHQHSESHHHSQSRGVIEERDVVEEREVLEVRGVGDWVTVTMNGQVVSWQNAYTGAPASSTKKSSAVAVKTKAVATSAAHTSTASKSSSASRVTATSRTAAYTAAASGYVADPGVGSRSWGRQAYYNSASGVAKGVTFLNNHGGTGFGSGSGTFDTTFGMSLSYASTDGCTSATTPKVLADTIIPSNAEIVVMSNKKCSNGDCGYVRDGTVAYHGWAGAQKAFFFEFQMPTATGARTAVNYNMPAIWLMNAQIPRTLEYGDAACSCWTSGCGELDIFEVLTGAAYGSNHTISHYHGANGGGVPQFVARPTTTTIKAALVKNGDYVHIKRLDDSFDFGATVTAAQLNDICQSTTGQLNKIALFDLLSQWTTYSKYAAAA